MSLHFLSYAETFAALRSRYPSLTEAELRMWVGHGHRDLVAFENKPGNTRRSRLRNPACRFVWSGSAVYNISIYAILDCWFPAKHVLRFIPTRRYLTYEQLVERWQSRTSIDIHKFIADRVQDFRKKLGYGFFEFGAFHPLGRLDLPLEEYVFAVDQVEKKEKEWFIGATGTRSIAFRPFQDKDVRYFSRLPKWSKQQAGYLVQGQVRVSASGHYCYDDSSVVFCYAYFPSYETQPPEADYADLFSRLSFPIKPLEFIEFCEPRGIPLPPALVASVKEIAGASTLPEPTMAVPILDNRPPPMPQKTSEHGKMMRAARAEKSGEKAIRAKAVELAAGFKNRNRSASKKRIADYVCDQLFDEAHKAGVLTSRENAPDTIGRWLSKGQTGA
ncbi:MAG: hypothetical protein P9F19_11035 [Candidatus Contendobacter sp.]|nr:hypothetical protein [Candidatus Contendobacter sp.]MDG4557902.1 hypothetical protein [Candidatus Contendobacter sp.]